MSSIFGQVSSWCVVAVSRVVQARGGDGKETDPGGHEVGDAADTGGVCRV